MCKYIYIYYVCVFFFPICWHTVRIIFTGIIIQILILSLLTHRVNIYSRRPFMQKSHEPKRGVLQNSSCMQKSGYPSPNYIFYWYLFFFLRWKEVNRNTTTNYFYKYLNAQLLSMLFLTNDVIFQGSAQTFACNCMTIFSFYPVCADDTGAVWKIHCVLTLIIFKMLIFFCCLFA